MPAGVGRRRPPRGSSRKRPAAANRAGTEEEEVASLSNEFFKILRPGMYETALGLPAKLASVLGGRRDLKLQLAGGDKMPLWDVEVIVDEKRGDIMSLGGDGWAKFARSHQLQEGFVLVFRYGGRGDLIVTVFDLTTCRKEYYGLDGGADMFEFLKILLPGMYEKALGMPAMLTPVLGGRRHLKLQLAGGDTMPLWDVEVFVDEKHGDMCLGGGGWKEFACFYDLRQGYALLFRYGGRGDLIVTIFDLTTCRKECDQGVGSGAGASCRKEDGQGAGFSASVGAGASASCRKEGGQGTRSGAGTSGGSLPILEPSQFAVTLRQCNLEEKHDQYLNVPKDFHNAHGYLQRRRVVLQMGGRSWVVNLKHGRRPPRSSFQYGWHVLRRQQPRGWRRMLLPGDLRGRWRRLPRRRP